jgi:hypothetical protein
MGNEDLKICAYEECNKKFHAKVYNAIYCSAECRKIVTNRNLLASYYEKKANKNKKRTGIIKKLFVNLAKESAM